VYRLYEVNFEISRFIGKDDEYHEYNEEDEMFIILKN